MNTKEMQIVHVINSKGEHITIPFVDADTINEDTQSLNGYKFDLEWYLSHGYKKFDDITKQIEGKYYETSSCNK